MTTFASSTRSCWRRPFPATAHVAAVLGLLLAIVYWPILFGGQTLAYHDYGAFGYPLAHYQRECFWRGEIPLWNPLNNCGIPFLAQWNTLTLYPFSLLYLLLPLPWGLSFFCVAHLFWGGLGTYRLARALTGERIGASMAALAFAFSGLSFNCVLWPNNAAGLAWMLWFLLLWRRVLDGRRRAVPLAALAGAMQILSGAPEVILQTWLLAAVFCLVHVWEKRTEPWGLRLRALGRCGLAVVLANLLAAAQWLPFLDLLHDSHRTAGFAGAIWSMPWWGWGNFLVPLFQAYPWDSGVFYQWGQYWTSSYYLGAAIFALAVFAAVRVRRPAAIALGLLTLLWLLLALGNATPVYGALQKILPLVAFLRYPVKATLLLNLLIPLLAAYGIAELLRAGADVRRLNSEATGNQRSSLLTSAPARVLVVVGLIAISAMLGIAGYNYFWPEPFVKFSTVQANVLVRLLWLILIFAALAAVCHYTDLRKRAMLIAGLWLLVFADVVTQAPGLVLTADASVFQPFSSEESRPLAPADGRKMLSRAAQRRFYETVLPDLTTDTTGRRLGAFANFNLLDGEAKLDGFYSLYPKAQLDVLHVLSDLETNLPAGLLDFLAVRATNSAEKVFAWQPRPTAMPLVSAGQVPLWGTPESALALLREKTFDPRSQVAVVSNASNLPKAVRDPAAQVRDFAFSAQRWTFTVQAAQPALAVVSQTWNKNWRATVNGRAVSILKANHAFQAIPVDAGLNRVELRYVDQSFYWGMACSGLGVILTLFGLFFPPARRGFPR